MLDKFVIFSGMILLKIRIIYSKQNFFLCFSLFISFYVFKWSKLPLKTKPHALLVGALVVLKKVQIDPRQQRNAKLKSRTIHYKKT